MTFFLNAGRAIPSPVASNAGDVEALLRDFDMSFTPGGLPSEHLSHFALVLDAGCALDATLEDSGNMKRLLMLTSVAAMVAMAPPAYADPESDAADTDFLSQLKQAGLTYQDPAAAIRAAKDICDLVDKGSKDTDIITNLQLRNPGFEGNGAAKFTAIAAGKYCPKYLTGEGGPPKPAEPAGDQGNPKPAEPAGDQGNPKPAGGQGN
jgi:hypothetical protein